MTGFAPVQYNEVFCARYIPRAVADVGAGETVIWFDGNMYSIARVAVNVKRTCALLYRLYFGDSCVLCSHGTEIMTLDGQWEAVQNMQTGMRLRHCFLRSAGAVVSGVSDARPQSLRVVYAAGEEWSVHTLTGPDNYIVNGLIVNADTDT